MPRVVVVLEYEVADLSSDAMDRLAVLLRSRGVHDSIEGAHQVQGTVYVAAAADRVVDFLREDQS